MKLENLYTGRSLVAWLLIFFAGIPLFLAFNLHSRCGIYNYHAEIFADKAGYYVYLPSTFIYDFDARSFPDSIVQKTGGGFNLGKKKGKVITKYSSGVAVMQSPFFLGAHALARPLGYEANGFSLPYHKAIDIAAVFYLFWGIYFLQKFLRYYIDNKFFVGLSLLILTYGTNLIYYATQETGMSHIYSFFLFSLFLYYWKRIMISSKVKIKHIIILSFTIGIILLVRQINLLFLPFVFLIDLKGIDDLKSRFIKLYKYLPIIALIATVCLLPQICYYMYLSGKPYMYSYGNESFVYKFSPKILEVCFAFENGFFTYNPIHVFTIVGIFWMIYQRNANGRTLLCLFLFITYLNAAWWSPLLGCGYGHRGFVEFYPLFSLAFLTILYKLLYDGKSLTKTFTVIVLGIFIFYNFKLGLRYDGCWYGKDSWDYAEYIRFVSSSIF
jgi:hypothetical protein